MEVVIKKIDYSNDDEGKRKSAGNVRFYNASTKYVAFCTAPNRTCEPPGSGYGSFINCNKQMSEIYLLYTDLYQTCIDGFNFIIMSPLQNEGRHTVSV